MYKVLFLFFFLLAAADSIHAQLFNRSVTSEETLVRELFRLRNEHKADSAELFFADTVQVYMKNLRNVPRRKITQSDKQFWKSHPKNKFEITGEIEIRISGNTVVAVIYGKEYLNGTGFIYEKIEIKFNSRRKIFFYRGYHWNGKFS